MPDSEIEVPDVAELTGAVSRLAEIANADSVVGPVQERDGRTVIPLASVSAAYGLGMGYEVRVGRLRASWSRPRRVTITRGDGLAETAPVQDGAGRVILTLCAAAAFVAAASFTISRR